MMRSASRTAKVVEPDLGRVLPGLLARLVLGAMVLSSALCCAGELAEVDATSPLAASLPDLTGGQHSLDELRGKVLLVNFWASWCPPCVEEMPSIQRLADALQGKPFAALAVNVGESALRVKAMVKRVGLRLPVLLDRDSATFQAWEASVLPTTYLLDAAGVPRYVGRGPLEWDSAEVRGLVDRLLHEADPAASEHKP